MRGRLADEIARIADMRIVEAFRAVGIGRFLTLDRKPRTKNARVRRASPRRKGSRRKKVLKDQKAVAERKVS